MPTKWHVHPATTQVSLSIRPVWTESSLCAQWIAKDPRFLHADSEDSNQTGWMASLIWVFAGCTCHFVGLSCGGSNTSRRGWDEELFGWLLKSQGANVLMLDFRFWNQPEQLYPTSLQVSSLQFWMRIIVTKTVLPWFLRTSSLYQLWKYTKRQHINSNNKIRVYS